MSETETPPADVADEAGAPAPIAVTPEAAHRIIEYAWHCFNGYDAQSGRVKRSYQRIRKFIILITWFTTLLSVLSAFAEEVSAGLSLYAGGFQLGLWAVLVGVIALALFQLGRGPAVRAARKAWAEPGSLSARALRAAAAFLRETVRRRREWLLLLALAALLLALLPGVVSALSGQLGQGEFTQRFFQFFLVVLPLASTGLLTFAGRFEPGVAWVGFRDAAEAIRRQLYVTRLRAGENGHLTPADLEALTDVIQRARKQNVEEMGVNTPLLGDDYAPGAKAVQPNYLDHPDDDGYSPITLDQYVRWRLLPQTGWYRGRIRKDYQQTRRFRAALLLVGGLGAFLAAFGLGQFVAVTVAGTTALIAWMSLMQYEQSYTVYMRTIMRLEDMAAYYYVNLSLSGISSGERTPEQQAEVEKFLNSVEDIFDEEREVRRLSVLQAQEAAEDAMSQLVSAYGSQSSDLDSLMNFGGSEEYERRR